MTMSKPRPRRSGAAARLVEVSVGAQAGYSYGSAQVRGGDIHKDSDSGLNLAVAARKHGSRSLR